MKILEQWAEQISAFKRLSLKEAQELYKKAIDTNDEALKKVYMDEVILGTLYVVYEYIKRNNLEFLTSAVNDANDITRV